jgi:DeoR family transcriptional regulator, fructose operon transcriptional repressor
MTRDKRHAAIREILQREEFVTTADLSQRLGISESTIRRDFAELEEEGALRRSHGGGRSLMVAGEGSATPTPQQPRASPRIEIIEPLADENQRIAAAASRLVRDGESVILDAGLGSLVLAQALKSARHNLTVLTTAIDVALELAGCFGVSAILTGGHVIDSRSSLVGYVAERTLQGMKVDRLFLTASAVDLTRGLTTSQLQEIAIKQAMIQAAREVILVVEHGTFGRNALMPFAPLSAVHRLVTGRELSVDLATSIARMGIELIRA